MAASEQNINFRRSSHPSDRDSDKAQPGFSRAATPAAVEPLRWAALPSIDAPSSFPDGEVYGHSATVLGRSVWVLGGLGARPGSLGDLAAHKLDLDTGRWSHQALRGAASTVEFRDEDGTVVQRRARKGWFPCHRWGHSVCAIWRSCHPDSSPDDPVLLLCGGFNRECNFGDTWRSNARVTHWTDLEKCPTFGAYHSLVFHPARGEALLFGGQCCVGGPYDFSDRVCIYGPCVSGGSWQPLSVAGPRPQPRAQHGAALAGRTMVVHGGADDQRGFNDVWSLALDGGSQGWTELLVSGGAAPYAQPRLRPKDFRVASCRGLLAAGGRGGRRLLVLGRDAEGRFRLFAFDARRGAWLPVPSAGAPGWRGNFAACVAPAGGGPSSPGPRRSRSEAEEMQLLVFGGHSAGQRPRPVVFAHAVGLSARPSALLRRTLLAACRGRPGAKCHFPEEALAHVLGFLSGHIAELLI